MEQSVSRVSRVGAVAKIAVALLLGLAGLTVVGVDSAFAAAGPPTITAVGPQSAVCPSTGTQATGLSGTADGGTKIELCGNDFGAKNNTTTTVTVGGVAAAVTVNSNTSMTVTVPAAASSTAAAAIIVTNTALTVSKTSSCTTAASPGPACQYNYTWVAPAVTGTGLVPVTSAVQSGSGNPVTITVAGTYTAGQLVSLAGFSKLPAAVYPVLVGGTGSFTIAFSGGLFISDTGTLSPTSAGALGSVSGGTSVTVRGTDFSGATGVSFGGTPASSFTVNSPDQITAVAPLGSAGTADVTVTNPAGTSTVSQSSDTFTYVTTPTVTGVTGVTNPASGPTGGGTLVTVNGTSFTGVTAVKFGATDATKFTVNGLNSITAVAPAGVAGTVHVTVATGLGTSTPGTSDTFTYASTLAVAPGTASYSNAAGQPVPATAATQAGGVGTPVTVSAIGVWNAGAQVALSGFTNGLTAGTYTIATGATGSFTVPFAGTVSGASTGSVLIPTTTTPASVDAVSQVGGAGTAVTITSTGSWTAGQQVYLTGFTNGLTTGNYTLASGTSGSFTVPFAGAVTACSTSGTPCSTADTIVGYQAQSFNAETLVTGGGIIDPNSLNVTVQPGSGHVSAVGGQLIYVPAQATPTSYIEGANTVWKTSVTTTGTQTATFQICDAAPNQATCTTGTMTYAVSTGGAFVGNQLSASGLLVSVVNDTGGGVVVPANAAPGSTFTSVTAPPMTGLPATNSGFVVSGIGGYQAITPVPTGVTLVPGTLNVTGGDPATVGRYTATLCDTAVYVSGTCTANTTGNFHTSGEYIETSLTVGDQIPGGSQLSLPSITAQWKVTGAAGTTVSSFETEFVVVTNVVTIGTLILDAYPTDLASFLNQGQGAPVPAYQSPPARWSVPIANSGPVAPAITSADNASFTVGTAGTFTVTTTGNPVSTITKTGTLPSGLTFTDNGDGTATLAGTPAGGTAGAHVITIGAANGTLPNASQSFTINVNQAPAITSAASATFTVGTAGNFAVTGTGFPAPTFSVTAGTLPSGVTLASNGTLSGTPAAGTGGTHAVTITGSNGTAPDATQAFTLTVDEAPTITSTNATSFFEGTPGTFAVTATGYPVASFSETGALPSGVTLASNGTLSGTPAASTSGSYPITITANNGVSPNATQSFTLTVSTTPIAPAITSANSTTFTVGTLGTFAVTGTGNPSPTFAVTAGTLPSGVTLASNGTLSGTPAAGTGGTHVVTITAHNGVGSDATQSFTLTVDEAPGITSANSVTFKVGTAGTFPVTATGYPAPTFAETGALPSGVTLATNGTLAGTPAAGTGGTYAITITASNGIGTAATQAFTLTVDQPPAITSANSATFTNGSVSLFNVTGTGFPTPTYTETGALPAGITFVNGTLSGTPTSTGVFPIVILATNGVSPNASQNFTLTVPGPPAAPTVTSVTSAGGQVTAAWAPGSNGGSPILSYTATATPGGLSCTVNAPATSCTITGLTNGTPVTVTVVAHNALGNSPASSPSQPATPSANIAIPGYWMATSAGAVLTNGAAVTYGSPAALALSAPIVALTPTPDRKGYWLVGSDGGVFSYGDATFYGSTGGTVLNAPIVGMASTADGKGYWLVAADGGVFAYGDAGFAGSMGGKPLNAPIVGIAGNGTGGYLLVAADGGVFAYGSAGFHGSAGNVSLVSPIVGIAALPDGSGYYLAAADGGVFSYGAPFFGSASGVASGDVVGITGGTNGGYTLATSTGAVYAYGAGYFGNQGGTRTTAPIIGIAS